MKILEEDQERIEHRGVNYMMDVYFNGERFTGLLKEGWGRYNFVNGNAEGISEGFYASGNKGFRAKYSNGELLWKDIWYETGEYKKRIQPDYIKLHGKDGQIIRIKKGLENREYYPNGKLMQKSVKRNGNHLDRIFYDLSGKEIFQVNDSIGKREEIFKDDRLEKTYYELLSKFYPELNEFETSEKFRILTISHWLWSLYDKGNVNSFYEKISRLCYHDLTEISKPSICIFGMNKFRDKFISNDKKTKEENERVLMEILKLKVQEKIVRRNIVY